MNRSLLAALASAAPALGQTFETPVPLPGDRAIAPSAGNQERPFTAAGAGHFLCVWQDDASSLVDTVFGQQAFGWSTPGNSDIHGMLLGADGTRALDAPIVVDHESWDQLHPRAAWNGSEYLVVFESSRPTSSFHSKGIWGVRVSGTGQVLDPTPFLVYDSPGGDERTPAVASLGGSWLVAWAASDPITGFAVVDGRTVTGPGALGLRRNLVPGASGVLPSEFELAASGGSYLLAYGINYGSGMRARVFDAAGQATTGILTLASSSGFRPGLAAGAAGFYAAWIGGGSFRGTTVSPAGVVGTPEGTVLAPGSLGGNASVSVGFDGSTYTVAFDASPDVYAVRVGAAGNVLSSPFSVTTSPRTLDDIAVAGGGGVTHVAWTDRRGTPNSFGLDQDDVWGATLDAAGALSPAAPVSVSPPSQFGVRIAGDEEHGFLAVFASLSAGMTRIVAQRLDARGRAVAAEPFEVFAADRTLGDPDVAWNGSEFLVVWSHNQSTVSYGAPTLVEARRCTADGTLLDPAPITVMEGHRCSVDAVGRTFLVVARFHHSVLQSNSVIRCRRIDGATGALLDPSAVLVSYGSGTTDVVGLADRWLVAFSNIRGAFVDVSGVPGAPFYAADSGSSSAGPFRLSSNPAKDEALLAYEWRDFSGNHFTSNIRMRRFDLGGNSPDPLLGPTVNGSANAQLRPVGIAFGDDYEFVWTDHRRHPNIEPGLGDVYAARLDANALVLDPTGVPVLDTPNAEGSPDFVASGGGQAIFAASAIERGGPLSGMHRVRTGAFDAAPLGTAGCAQPNPNSSGQRGELAVTGSTRAADRDLRLTARRLPQGALTLFLCSRTHAAPTQPPGSQGFLCLSGQIGRYVAPGLALFADAAGSVGLTVDPGATPTPAGPTAIVAGETWSFQAWHRDVAGGGPSSNFTTSATLTFR